MQDISYQELGHVGVITLMRPEVHNALRLETYAELTELVHNATARVLVITGAGRSFCSGDDVRAVGGGAGPVFDEEITPAAGALLATDIPVIAAVNGTAVGWGMELALLADIRIAARGARFGELFVKRGMWSDVAGLGRLAQIVGRELAAELLFTGEMIDAERARQIGLCQPSRRRRAGDAGRTRAGGEDRGEAPAVGGHCDQARSSTRTGS